MCTKHRAWSAARAHAAARAPILPMWCARATTRTTTGRSPESAGRAGWSLGCQRGYEGLEYSLRPRPRRRTHAHAHARPHCADKAASSLGLLVMPRPLPRLARVAPTSPVPHRIVCTSLESQSSTVIVCPAAVCQWAVRATLRRMILPARLCLSPCIRRFAPAPARLICFHRRPTPVHLIHSQP